MNQQDVNIIHIKHKKTKTNVFETRNDHCSCSKIVNVDIKMDIKIIHDVSI